MTPNRPAFLDIPPLQSAHGTVQLPGSKSISNRALILHALSYSAYDIVNLSDCDDTKVMVNALNSDGRDFDIKAAGTAMRFLTAFLSKIVGGYVGGRFARLDHKISLALGFGLNARGIMELVIANIAYKAGIINTEIFSMLVIMGLITTLATPFLLKRAFKSIDKIA